MNVPGYIYYAKQGDYQKAYEVLRETNPLPAICGRVCYHPCEDACNRGCIDQPLAIASLKRFITDQVDTERLELPQISKNGKTVAIVGSGPAGLTAAHDLVLSGYNVTIFEAQKEPGGMLRYAIPEYRLPKDILKKEITYIEQLGVQIKTGAKVGEQIKLDELTKSYNAVFFATGANKDVELGIPGEKTSGVVYALDLLQDVNSGKKVELGKSIVVIGGGNSAIDAARVSRRLGGKVTIIYRRSRAEMPAYAAEVEAAEKEGIEIVFLAAPIKIVPEHGKVSKVECSKMKLGPPDASGRPAPIPQKGSEFTVDADTVIPAIGQAPDRELLKGMGLKLSQKGTILVDERSMSSKGIFAGGDVVTGPLSVIEAMASGRKAAISIHNYLRGESSGICETEKRALEKLSQEEIDVLKKRFPTRNRVVMPEVPSDKRVRDFREVEEGYSKEQVQRESERCMTTCIFCEICWKVCPAQAITLNGKSQQVGAAL
jgi:formate dehydrogenase beta subunit